jgi:hypothetical protein
VINLPSARRGFASQWRENFDVDAVDLCQVAVLSYELDGLFSPLGAS